MASAAELSILLNAKDQATGPIGNVNKALGGLGQAAEAPTSRIKSLVSGMGDFVTKAGLAVFGATQLAQGIGGMVGGLFDGNVAFENVRAQLMAFTKDGGAAEAILNDINAEAAKTPFSFQAMAEATAGLIPAANQAGVALMDLVRDAEILAASNPAQGLEGAAFALREAVSGDFTSIIERFNLPRQYINQLKEEGLPNIEIVRRAMAEMGYDMDLVSNLSQTASGRWSTLMDTFANLKRTLMQGIFDALSGEMANLQTWLDKNSERLTEFAALVGRGLASAARYGIDGIKALVDLLKGPLAYAWVLVRDGIKTFAAALRGDWSDDSRIRPLHRILGMLGTVIREQVIPFAAKMVEFFRERIMPVFQAVLGIVQKVMSGFGEGGLGGALRGALDGAREFASAYINYLGGLAGIGKKIIDWIAPYVPVVIDLIRDMIGRAVDWLRGDGFQMFSESMASLGATLWSWVSDNVGPMLERLADLLTQARDWLIRDGIPLVRDAFSQYTGPVLAAFGEVFVKLLVWLRDVALPELAKGALALGKALYEWVAPIVPPLLAALGSLLLQLGNWIVDTAAPAIAAKLAEWGKRFWEWVAPQIGPLLAELGALLVRFGDWIVHEAAPVIIGKLTEWAAAFVAWVGPQIPPLLSALWDLLNQLSDWVGGTALPVIIEKLAEWGKAFIEWVAKDALPYINEKLNELSKTILSWIIDTALPSIIEKLGDWGKAFLDWIKDEVLPFLAGKLDEIMTAIGDWVSDNIDKAKTAMLDIGTAILDGIASGIRNGASSIVKAAIDYALSFVPSWARGALGISSPAKVMIPVGEAITSGVAAGIESGVEKYVRPAMDALADFIAGYPIPVPSPVYPGGPGYSGLPGVPGGPLPPASGGGVGTGGGTIGARPVEDGSVAGEVGGGVSTGPVPSASTLMPNQVSNSRDAGAKGDVIAKIDLAAAQMQGNVIAQALEMRLVPALESAVERGIRRAMAGVI